MGRQRCDRLIIHLAATTQSGSPAWKAVQPPMALTPSARRLPGRVGGAAAEGGLAALRLLPGGALAEGPESPTRHPEVQVSKHDHPLRADRCVGTTPNSYVSSSSRVSLLDLLVFSESSSPSFLPLLLPLLHALKLVGLLPVRYLARDGFISTNEFGVLMAVRACAMASSLLQTCSPTGHSKHSARYCRCADGGVSNQARGWEIRRC